MKLFLSPFKPAMYLGIFLVLCIAVPFGRLEFGDGGLWTMAGAATLWILFAIGGSNWPAMNQLGASFNRWMNSAALTALVAAVILTPLTAASAVYHQAHSPYYKWYDPFIVTNGEPMPWTNFSGEPYFVEDAAQDLTSVASTVLLHFVIFLTMALTGVAIGLARGTRMQWFMLGSMFVGGFTGFVVGIRRSEMNPFDPNISVFFVATAALVVLAASAIVFARTRRFVP
ncbi:hypothetical protein HMPREF3104_01105 [Corynebacterium sp. HMSC30G07]|uniref:hypothetical protein n=1 Tax=Corynebacterium sp. HMSC30G07 TaxID=1581072 RepID=UPI0008A24C21|nr:hypothetical protein [Corynebacterium sp. HMSC30G07]OFT77758.1 hypothetical protein HMPREF3104_01105 [Corynebacterium sp. HMSC30G07]